jgi:hypothetical protein
MRHVRLYADTSTSDSLVSTALGLLDTPGVDNRSVEEAADRWWTSVGGPLRG